MGYYIKPQHSLEPDYDQMAQKIKQMLKQDQVDQIKNLINGCEDQSIEVDMNDVNILKQILFDAEANDQDVSASDFEWHDPEDDPY